MFIILPIYGADQRSTTSLGLVVAVFRNKSS